MMLSVREKTKSFGGPLTFYEHPSTETKTPMRFSVFVPKEPVQKVLIWLSGLTCTDENFMMKAGALKYASEHGLALVAPDTSPRGLELPGEHDRWDFGSGAGFYLDATQLPWKDHYRMESYVVKELPILLDNQLGFKGPYALSGHSMGGHGALTLGLKYPELFSSVSAFAPIVAPSQVPWGQYAFSRYLGEEEGSWSQYDACCLVRERGYRGKILVDQGDADASLETQLRPRLFEDACRDAGVELDMRMQEGYDHGYFFVSTFIEDHLKFHLGLEDH